jgi:predicted transcriptional regulator with HTH domain
MSTEQKRNHFYEALLMEAQDRWATVEDVNRSLVYVEPKTEGYLDGLVHLREVEVQTFDDGVKAYKMTEFGKRWAEMMLLGS